MSNKQIVDKLITARIGLLLKHPFFGNMATRMPLVDVTDQNWCMTAATDGMNFFYNREFVDKLSNGNLEFLFAHEICHCIFDHFARTGSRDRRIANYAQDFAINQILVDEKVGERITLVKILQDNKYRGMAWEEIYDLLVKDAQKSKSKGGSGSMGDSDLQDFLDSLGKVLDEHIEQETFDEKASASGRPYISKEEAEQIKQAIRDAMQQAAAAAAGKTPAAISRLIKDLTESKVDWREVLQQNIQSVVRNDYSFQRYNRKSAHSGAVLPGLNNDETVEVAVAIDMSGSISEKEARAFLSEVKGIMDQYADYKIYLFSYDTEVYNPVTITSDTAHEFEEYVPVGGGGTLFECIYEHLKDAGIVPKKLINFTDGFPGNTFGDEFYCDTLFVVKGSNVIAPFGETVQYDKL